MKPLRYWLEEKKVTVDQLVAAADVDRRTVRAIASGNYTPSPDQRRRLSIALGVSMDKIAWGHAVPVEHMYGHGPQFGRSP